jgi:hypothetical protein
MKKIIKSKWFFILALIGLSFFIFKSFFNDEKNLTNELSDQQTRTIDQEKESERENDQMEVIQEEDGVTVGETNEENSEDGQPLVDNEESDLPDRIRLTVPFVLQAPNEVWDEIQEESCEEASLLMVATYLSEDKKAIHRKEAEEELASMIEFQNEKYGDYRDSDMEQLKTLAEDYFDLKSGAIIEDPTLEELKKILANERPIIVPAAGRLLENPFFTPPGPLYHNLVLIGYDDNRRTFIANDPGTRRGRYYEYDYEILMEAIHDFPGTKEDIEQGSKRVLYFEAD